MVIYMGETNQVDQRIQDDKSQVVKEMENEIFEKDMSLGNVDVEGPGIEIKLQDVGFSTSSDSTNIIDQKSAIIHDTDIMSIINELKYF